MSAPTSTHYNHTSAASTTSSSRPIYQSNHSSEHLNSPPITMTDSGKAPAYPATNGASSANSAPRSQDPLVKVQPPRREDLQPSYARVIEPDDADADGHGWYGGMVCPPRRHTPPRLNTLPRSTPLAVSLAPSAQSHAVSAARTPTNPCRKAMLAW
jgi:hypothetical protein